MLRGDMALREERKQWPGSQVTWVGLQMDELVSSHQQATATVLYASCC